MYSLPPFKTPYDTTALSGFNREKIKKEIEHSLVSQNSGEMIAQLKHPSEDKPTIIYGVMPKAEGDITSFNQPMLVQVDNIDSVIVDMRPFTKADRVGAITISASSDYKFLFNYACITNSWVNNGHSILATINVLPGKVYATWIGNAITRLLSLDAKYQLHTKVMAGMFFECQFEKFEGDDFTDRERRRVAIACSKYARINSNQAEELLMGVVPMNSLEEFITELKKLNPIYDSLTIANVYAAIARSWFGPQASVLSAVAVEYPPALYVMIDYALNHAGFNKTAIGNIVWNDRNSPEAKSFNMGVSRIYNDAYLND